MFFASIGAVALGGVLGACFGKERQYLPVDSEKIHNLKISKRNRKNPRVWKLILEE